MAYSPIQSLTEFVRYVSPTNASAASTTTNSHPFNVLDYGTAAAQIGAAATQLETLLASVNQSVPRLENLSKQTKTNADAVVRLAIFYGVVLVFILLIGLMLAGLTYRFLLNKLAKVGRK